MNKTVIIIATVVIVIYLVVTVAVVLLSRKGPISSQVTINDKTFSVDVADTREEREKGLSGRKKLDAGEAMLFVFEETGLHTFWMKDMKFNLDIIFIKDDKIVTIHKNVEKPSPDLAPAELEHYAPRESANFVLEINSGLSDKYSFKEGDTVKIENIGN